MHYSFQADVHVQIVEDTICLSVPTHNVGSVQLPAQLHSLGE